MLSVIDSVANNTSARMDCPLCRGKNTLSVMKENGKVFWHCFKAQCSMKGADTYLASVQEVKVKNKPVEFTIPDSFRLGLNDEVAYLLERYNCIEAYSKGWFECGWDIRQQRVCFVIRDKGKIAGLIGRAIRTGVKPKTLNYPNSSMEVPFICGNGENLVLTEDCLSAISVTRLENHAGMALLGTTMKDSYINYLKPYKTIIIALDRDARKKALALKQKLSYHHPQVKIWWLDKDIKDMLDEEIKIKYVD